jgi:hypothetical protein
MYLEGVPVKFTSIQIRSIPNAPTSAHVRMPPFPSLKFIQPRTLVHIFYYDFQNEGNPTEDQRFKLAFEGEVVGYGYSKTPESREMVLECTDLSNNWVTSYLGFDQAVYDKMAYQGTNIVNGASGTTTSEFNAGVGLVPNPIALALGKEDQNIARALNRAFKDAAITNPFFLLADSRHRYTEKVVSLIDKDIVNLFTAEKGLKVSETVGDGYSVARSLFDLVMGILGIIQYEFIANPMASYVPDRPDEGSGAISVGSPLLGSFIMKPSTLFMAPPMCNVLYPGQYTSINFSRRFIDETTRMRVTGLPFLGQKTVLNTGQYIVGGDISSDAEGNPVSELSEASKFFGISNNYYDMLTKEEKIKGVVARFADISSSTLEALRVTSKQKSNIGNGRTRPVSTSPTAGIKEPTDGKSKGDIDNQTFWRQISQYEYLKSRFSTRFMSVQAEFNPNLVCGFPALVINNDGSYYGEVAEVVHNIDGGSGVASTSIVLSFAREAEYNEKSLNSVPFWISDLYRHKKVGEAGGAYDQLFGVTSVFSAAKNQGDFPANLTEAAERLLNEYKSASTDAKKSVILNRTVRESIANREQVFDLINSQRVGDEYINSGGSFSIDDEIETPSTGSEFTQINDVADYIISKTFPDIKNPDRNVDGKPSTRIPKFGDSGTTPIEGENVEDLIRNVASALKKGVGPFVRGAKLIAKQIKQESLELSFSESSSENRVFATNAVVGSRDTSIFVERPPAEGDAVGKTEDPSTGDPVEVSPDASDTSISDGEKTKRSESQIAATIAKLEAEVDAK